MWYFWNKASFAHPKRTSATGDGKCPPPPPSTHTHQFKFRGIIFSTGEGDKTAQITLAFYLGLSWQPSQAEQHWSISSVIRTAIFQDFVSQVSRKPHLSLRQCCLSGTHFSPSSGHNPTDVSACPQHRLLRKENDHQKLVYALTALALKSTSWTRNVYCAHLPTSSSLITGIRLIPSQLQPGSDNGCTPYDPEKQLPLLPQLPLFSHQDTGTRLTLRVDSSPKDTCTYPGPLWPALGTKFLVTFDGNTVTYATEKVHDFKDHMSLQTFYMGQTLEARLQFLVNDAKPDLSQLISWHQHGDSSLCLAIICLQPESHSINLEQPPDSPRKVNQ